MCQNCTFQTYLPLDPATTSAVPARLIYCSPIHLPHVCLWPIAHPISPFWNVLPLFSPSQTLLVLGAQLQPNCLYNAFWMTPLSSEEAFFWGPSALTTVPSTLGCPLCVHPASQPHGRFLKKDLALCVPGTPMSSTPGHLHSRCLISKCKNAWTAIHCPKYPLHL